MERPDKWARIRIHSNENFQIRSLDTEDGAVEFALYGETWSKLQMGIQVLQLQVSLVARDVAACREQEDRA